MTDEDYGRLGFEWELVTDQSSTWLSLFANESGSPETVGRFVQAFLRRFRPRDHFKLTWATFCSKLRPGAFSGGGIFATAHEVRALDVDAWFQQQAREGDERALSPDCLAADAHCRGVLPEQLDELVHDAKGSEAAAINNEGLDAQVEYLVEQLGAASVRDALVRLAPGQQDE
jgi:hypothetical protein